ncbi:MAG: hypothetical protein NTV21_09585 [Planctomycetota bacterium]|nr:hypothetical protein [Planctomycetota bacterium]
MRASTPAASQAFALFASAITAASRTSPEPLSISTSVGTTSCASVSRDGSSVSVDAPRPMKNSSLPVVTSKRRP